MDHGASTPVHPRVLEAMLPYWTEAYGNPSSSHQFGRTAENGIENARHEIAERMSAKANEIIFTGCGSESDNLALRGVMWAARLRAGAAQNHLIVSEIEHSAVLKTAVQMRDQLGFDVTILPVDSFGQIRLAELEAAIRPETVLISIMAANNEIGTLQPIMEIGEIARKHQVLFHTDAIQSAAVMRWNTSEMPIDLISFAPHKFYGPKGVGILYARDGIELLSNLTGGGQENGRRAGTSNVAFAVGASTAFSLAMDELEDRNAHYRQLRDQLIGGMLAAMPHDCVLTGHPTERLPHNASFAFRNVNGNDLLMHLDLAGVAASSGSACKVGDPKPSATLASLGLGDAWTRGGLRLTVGQQNQTDEIEYTIEIMPKIIAKLQQLQAAGN